MNKSVPPMRQTQHVQKERAKWWLRAVLALIAWFLVFLILNVLPQTGAVVHMRLTSDRAGAAQWFYDQGNGYSESASVTASLRAGENDVTFRLPSGDYRALRFDPINNAGRVKVESLRWVTLGDISTSSLGKEHLVPLANIDHVINAADGIEIWPVAGTDDPQMQLAFKAPLHIASGSLAHKVIVAAEISLLLLVAFELLRLLSFRVLTFAALGAATSLIVAMAVLSPTDRSVHPDEFSHLRAYQYYLTHWAPPSVGDPAIQASRSVWGYTYLDELDVVYAIAARLTPPLLSEDSVDLQAARWFQIGLWVVLWVLALCRRNWTLVVSVALLSPQIFYIFSYFNADAFPFLLSLILGGLISGTDNGLHRHLEASGRRSAAVWIAAVCFGLLLVSKRNYLVVVPLLLLWLAVRHLGIGLRTVGALLGGFLLLGVGIFIDQVPGREGWHIPLILSGALLVVGVTVIHLWRALRDARRRGIMLRFVGFVLMCAAVALPRIAWDIWVNGSPGQKSARLSAEVEARALPDFKPSTIATGSGFATMVMAKRGVPLWDMILAPHNWLRTSFLSMFGVYGYMNIYASQWYYEVLGILTLIMFLIGLYATWRKQPRQWPAYAMIVVGGSAIVVVGSLMLSWVEAFQAQGRYLFPIFTLLAVLLGASADHVPLRWARVVIVVATIFSTGSFVFVALPNLIKP